MLNKCRNKLLCNALYELYVFLLLINFGSSNKMLYFNLQEKKKKQFLKHISNASDS